MIKKATEFVKANKESINPKYRENYHFMGDIGWINDSNGFTYFRGEYHLFFQYYPYDGYPGVMHWGHSKSKDLIHWEQLPVAIAPDQSYDKDGCWSGSSIVIDDILWIMYTGHSIVDGVQIQTQNLAYSNDGITFTKYEQNPVIKIDENFKDGNLHEFRDPFLFEHKGLYKVLLGTKKDEKSKLLQFSSIDLFRWKYDGIVYKNDELGTMFECPNMPSKRILVISPQNVKPLENDYWNVSSTIGFVGKYKNNKFIAKSYQELDHGLEFYAPQLKKIKGRVLMIPWMQMWGRRYFTYELGHKWQNAFTIIRELKIKNNRLIQKPIKELSKYVGIPSNLLINNNAKEIELSSKLSLSFDANKDYSLSLKDDDNEFIISYTSNDKTITVDRTNCKEQLGGVDNTLATKGIRKVTLLSKKSTVLLDIYLDRISIEMFINGGEETMSSLCYFNENKAKIFSNDDEIIAKYSLIKI